MNDYRNKDRERKIEEEIYRHNKELHITVAEVKIRWREG